jgi:hypothetical protein
VSESTAIAEDEAAPYEVPGPPVRALKPITDPLELRDRTIRDYRRNFARIGVDLSGPDLEAMAVADLNLAAAVDRDDAARPVPTAAQRAEAKQTRDEALTAKLAEDGIGLTRNQPRDLGPQLDLSPEYGLSERWRAAKARLLRIMAGASPPVRLPSGGFDFRAMVATCEAPALAYAFLEHWCNFDLRGMPETARHNPYFGMGHRDASLKLARAVEDLCDASTGIPGLGAWRTEK